jgi:hypothetical protein
MAACGAVGRGFKSLWARIILVHLFRPTIIILLNLNGFRAKHDYLSNFMYALKAPETRRQWPRRLKPFFDFLPID